MSASDNTPYLSRFFLKFIEIIAAGLATAVTGYLIAHLSGALRNQVTRDRKSTRLNSSHRSLSRMPSSA